MSVFIELSSRRVRPDRVIAITELIGTGKKQITMDKVAIERCAPYAAADAAITYRAAEFLRPKVDADGLLDAAQPAS